MKKSNIHVYKRSMDSINVILEHLYNHSDIKKDIIKDYFNIIRETVDFCEELILADEDEISEALEKTLEGALNSDYEIFSYERIYAGLVAFFGLCKMSNEDQEVKQCITDIIVDDKFWEDVKNKREYMKGLNGGN